MQGDGEVARKGSSITQPMPSETADLNYRQEFTPEEYQRISRGLIPQEMEDKWFAYLEEGTLFWHRSWTGFCMYRVELVCQGDRYRVRRALVNRNRQQYRSIDDAYDLELLRFLIDGLLLGRKVHFPLPPGLPEETPKGLFQHHASGTGYPERVVKPWWKFW